MRKSFFSKILTVILAVLFIFTLSACDINDILNQLGGSNNGGNTTELSDDEKVIEALSKVSIEFTNSDNEKSVTANIKFKSVEENGVTVNWQSNNQDVIGNDGTVSRPDSDTTVKITVTVTYKEASLTKSFNLTVKAKENAGTNPGEDGTVKTIEQILSFTNLEDGAVTEEKYTVTGKVVSIENASYGNCTITDGNNNLIVYGVYDNEGNKYETMADKFVVGDTITVIGPVKNYKGTIELFNTTLVKITKGEDNPGSDVGGNTEAKEASIADILATTGLEDGAVTEEKYTVTGRVVTVDNIVYGNCIITDETNDLVVYGVYDSDGNKYESMEYKFVSGDVITVTGPIKNYKGTLELINTTLIKVVKSGENPGTNPGTDPGDNPGSDVGGGTDEPTVVTKDVTIAELSALQLEVGATSDDFYKVTGMITAFANVEYGNLYISDGNVTFYVYGFYDATGAKYGDMTNKPVAGDTITIYGQVKNYNGKLEMVNAVLVSFEKGEGVEMKELTIAEVQAAAEGSYVKTSGTVVAVTARSFLVKDATGFVLVYMNYTAFTYEVGDKLILEGAISGYNGTNQFTNSVKIEKVGTEEVQTPTEVLEITKDNIESVINGNEFGKYFTAVGTIELDGSYYDLTFENSLFRISASYPLATLSLGLMANKSAKLTGYVLYPNADKSILNVIVTEAECLEEAQGGDLPIKADFTCETKETKLPDGWSWGVMNSKGGYNTGWQSFRANGESVVSPMFKSAGKFVVSFDYYMQNISTGTSKIKVTMFDKDGKEIASKTSENINEGSAGVENAKTLTFEFESSDICYISIEFIKESGGNVAFNKVTITQAQ